MRARTTPPEVNRLADLDVLMLPSACQGSCSQGLVTVGLVERYCCGLPHSHRLAGIRVPNVAVQPPFHLEGALPEFWGCGRLLSGSESTLLEEEACSESHT